MFQRASSIPCYPFSTGQLSWFCCSPAKTLEMLLFQLNHSRLLVLPKVLFLSDRHFWMCFSESFRCYCYTQLALEVCKEDSKLAHSIFPVYFKPRQLQVPLRNVLVREFNCRTDLNLQLHGMSELALTTLP